LRFFLEESELLVVELLSGYVKFFEKKISKLLIEKEEEEEVEKR
jgi:hypothetical protein